MLASGYWQNYQFPPYKGRVTIGDDFGAIDIRMTCVLQGGATPDRDRSKWDLMSGRRAVALSFHS